MPNVTREPTVFRRDLRLPPLAVEMVGDEGEDGVVAGFVVGMVTGDEDGEVYFRGEPGDGVPLGVAAGVGEGRAAGPRLLSWRQCRTMPSRFPQPRRKSFYAEIDRGEYWTI